MKKKILSVLLTLMLVLSFSLVTAVPVAAEAATLKVSKWTEDAANPIFDPTAKAYYPTVVKVSDNDYRMWYGSVSGVGYATSPDGLDWTEETNPVTGLVNANHPHVEYYADGFTGANSGSNPSTDTMYYRMWYWPGLSYSINDIRYAESADGTAWYNDQPLQNGTVPIISGGDPWWNRGSYGPSDVLYNPGASNTGTDWVFTMYYDGTTGGDEIIGLGFSEDGIMWTGYDSDNDGKADPVLVESGSGWDATYVSRCTVIKGDDETYRMWFSGGDGRMDHGIGYATSSDGLTWIRDANNPIFHKTDGISWRDDRSYCPMVIEDGGIYKMWFSGKDAGGNYAIGYATNTNPDPDYVTIQSAIDSATAGDTINVAAGTYSEWQDVSVFGAGKSTGIMIDKSLIVEGANHGVNALAEERGPESIINAQEADMGVLINGEGTIATFDGFTVENYNTIGILGGAFGNWGEDPVEVHILNNIVMPPTIEAPHNNNIQVGDGTTGTIIGNEVSWATLESPDWSGSGILVAGSSNVLVSYNYVHDCEGGIQIVGYLEYRDAPAENNVIEYNLVEDNESGIVPQMYSIGTIIRYNDVLNNDEGIAVMAIDYSWPEHSTPSGTEIHSNNIVGNVNYGVKSGLWGSDTGEVFAEEVDATKNWWGDANGPSGVGTGTGDSVSENVLFEPWYASATTTPEREHVTVKVGETEDVRAYSDTIQGGIDASLSGDTVIVAVGTYAEEITIGTANLTLQSASKWGAIIRPTTTQTSYQEAAIRINADGVTIDGFEIDGTTVANNGICGWNTSGLTIKNNKIHGAVNAWDGCGILLMSWGASGTVYDNLIEGNEVYDTGRMGIMVMDHDGSNYTVTSNNTITGNIVHDVWKVTWGDHGGGIQINVAKDCSITNNLIYDVRNDQRGIYMYGSAAGNTITLNTIRNNPIGIQLWISGEGGGPIVWGGETATSPQVRYNNIYDNSEGAISTNWYGTPMAMDAKYNWWGKIGGPGGEGLGNGDNVTANVDYDPWLTEDYATTIDDGIAYFGSTISLEPGWNTLSVPLKLKDSANTIAKIMDLGDFLTSENVEIVYQYNSGFDTIWENIGASATKLVPLRGYYIKILGTDTVDFPVLYSGQLGLPTLKLSASWNLIGSGFGIDKTGYGIAATDDLEDGQKDVATALYSIKDKCSVVVSPSTQGQVAAWGTTVIDSDKVMIVGEAYWVFMTTPVPTLAGFEVTPIYDLP